MDNNKPKIILLVIIIFIGLGFWYYVGNYRFDPFSAAKAHFDVGKDAIFIGDVDYGWSKVYVLNTTNGPRTVISVRSLFLWRAPAAVHFEASTDVIRTIGWMSFIDKRGQATVFAVETTDPNIAFVEVGPSSQRIKKGVEVGSAIIFSWNTAIQYNELKPVAYGTAGTPLYEYRYPQNTNVFREEELKWYPVNGNK